MSVSIQNLKCVYSNVCQHSQFIRYTYIVQTLSKQSSSVYISPWNQGIDSNIYTHIQWKREDSDRTFQLCSLFWRRSFCN